MVDDNNKMWKVSDQKQKCKLHSKSHNPKLHLCKINIKLSNKGARKEILLFFVTTTISLLVKFVIKLFSEKQQPSIVCRHYFLFFSIFDEKQICLHVYLCDLEDNFSISIEYLFIFTFIKFTIFLLFFHQSSI